MKNSLDTTNAITFNTSLWNLLPPELEREILELAGGLEHRDKMTKITSQFRLDLRESLCKCWLEDIVLNYETTADHLMHDAKIMFHAILRCDYQIVLEISDEIKGTGFIPDFARFFD